MGDVRIKARLNGPYLVPGPLTLRIEGGDEKRVDQETVACCRCGGSKDKPLCDGTHRSIGFTAAAVSIELNRD